MPCWLCTSWCALPNSGCHMSLRISKQVHQGQRRGGALPPGLAQPGRVPRHWAQAVRCGFWGLAAQPVMLFACLHHSWVPVLRRLQCTLLFSKAVCSHAALRAAHPTLMPQAGHWCTRCACCALAVGLWSRHPAARLCATAWIAGPAFHSHFPFVGLRMSWSPQQPPCCSPLQVFLAYQRLKRVRGR